MSWIIGSARTVGRSHIGSGSPCQDAAKCILFGFDSNFVLALSDGAGSAINSEKGSQLFVDSVCSGVAGKFDSLSDIDPAILDSFVISIIDSVRSQLRIMGDLKDFHATALIAVGSSSMVRVYHIGDGSALVGEKISKNEYLLHRSEPENGEFSNETFFFTLDGWKEKLRIATIQNPAFCILCSDGVDPFLWDANSGSRLGFVKPIIKKISESPISDQVDRLLSEIIEDPRTDIVTSDDKSIAIAISSSLDFSKIDKQVFKDKNSPHTKDYKQIDEEVKSALQNKNNLIGVLEDAKPDLKIDVNHVSNKIGLLLGALFSFIVLLSACISLACFYSNDLLILAPKNYLFEKLSVSALKIKSEMAALYDVIIEPPVNRVIKVWPATLIIQSDADDESIKEDHPSNKNVPEPRKNNSHDAHQSSGVGSGQFIAQPTSNLGEKNSKRKLVDD